MRSFNVISPDCSIKDSVQRKIDNLNKPKGSLGRLESLAMQICLIQHTPSPSLNHPCHLLFGADHGIECEGVSASPRDVTWQQMINFTRGGGGVNMFCRQHGFKLRIIDVGVDHDLSHTSGIINRKIMNGTNNFLNESAMDESQFDRAIDVGEEMAELCFDEGCDILCVGEMGIANTSASSIWMSLLCGIALEKCVGAGSGLSSTKVVRKLDILKMSIDRFAATHPTPTTKDILQYFGGLEMVASVGAMLRAAELHKVIMVDGFIMTVCALAAIKIYPASKHHFVFCHQGDENGHALLLRHLEAKPLLALGLRLGEGTGALCAFPIIDSAVRMMNEMNDFDNAHITKYF